MSEPDTSVPPKHHEIFYFDGGNVIFQVENTLFNIDRSILCKDTESIFASMFKLPLGGAPAQGTGDENPIFLPEVPLLAFTNLLSFLYASRFLTPHQDSLKPSQWMEVLNLADKFGLESSIPLIISSIERSTIEEKDLVQLLAIAFRFRNNFSTSFIEKLFEDLCLRDQCLNIAEGTALGGGLTAVVAACRENMVKMGKIGVGNLPGCFDRYFDDLESL